MQRQKFLIDGFNLFYRWNKTAESFRTNNDISKAVKTAISTLAPFLADKKKNCCIIIDGGKTPGKAVQSGIKIEFSGPGKTADDLIIQKVKQSKNPGEFTVITTDHTLGGNARHLGSKAMSVESFINTLKTKQKNKTEDNHQPLRKFLKPSEKEVGEWLSVFGDGSDIIEEEM